MAAPKPSLQLNMSQSLVMTPQLQLAIKILQMPAVDLQDFVYQELMENPFLAPDDGSSETENTASEQDTSTTSTDELMTSDTMADDLATDSSWDDMYDSSGEIGGNQTASTNSYNGEDSDWQNNATADISLKDFLTQQLGTATNCPQTKFLCSYLIDAIDDAGYIRLDLKETAKQLKTPTKKLEQALSIIQTFEPTGIGARTLSECLQLQLANGGTLTTAEKIVTNNLELLATRNFKKLAKLAKCDEELIMEVLEDISHLNPKPGLQYGTGNNQAITPEVIVLNKSGEWVAELNADAMPKVLLNRHNMSGDKELKSYVNERMNRGQWLIKSLEQRARTIHKVANIIVSSQAAFFELGPEGLTPLTLKQVAEQAEVHESTVSRVTNGKFMTTPLGTFEMKYFFNSAINTTGGNTQIASQGVKSIIKRLIDAEDPKKPLSDEKLVNLLKDEGVDVARRTVAKYREAMGLGSSSQRKIRA